MIRLQTVRAMWRAFPAAPETRRLLILRWQFIAAAFLLAAMLVDPCVCKSQHGIALLIGPLAVFVAISGTRYLRLKLAADNAHRDALVEAAFRGEEPL